MKKLILTFGIILASIFTMQAQERISQTDKVLNEYTSVAQLTPDQVTKVRPMIDVFYATRKDNKEKYVNDKDGLKAANKANRENFRAQLKTVLTADQIQKVDDYQKAKKDRNQANGASNQE